MRPLGPLRVETSHPWLYLCPFRSSILFHHHQLSPLSIHPWIWSTTPLHLPFQMLLLNSSKFLISKHCYLQCLFWTFLLFALNETRSPPNSIAFSSRGYLFPSHIAHTKGLEGRSYSMLPNITSNHSPFLFGFEAHPASNNCSTFSVLPSCYLQLLLSFFDRITTEILDWALPYLHNFHHHS